MRRRRNRRRFPLLLLCHGRYPPLVNPSTARRSRLSVRHQLLLRLRVIKDGLQATAEPGDVAKWATQGRKGVREAQAPSSAPVFAGQCCPVRSPSCSRMRVKPEGRPSHSHRSGRWGLPGRWPPSGPRHHRRSYPCRFRQPAAPRSARRFRVPWKSPITKKRKGSSTSSFIPQFRGGRRCLIRSLGATDPSLPAILCSYSLPRDSHPKATPIG